MNQKYRKGPLLPWITSHLVWTIIIYHQINLLSSLLSYTFSTTFMLLSSNYLSAAASCRQRRFPTTMLSLSLFFFLPFSPISFPRFVLPTINGLLSSATSTLFLTPTICHHSPLSTRLDFINTMKGQNKLSVSH